MTYDVERAIKSKSSIHPVVLQYTSNTSEYVYFSVYVLHFYTSSKEENMGHLIIVCDHNTKRKCCCFQGSATSGLNIQSSFMFLTVSIVPLLIGTIAFLPKTRIPWPLPEHYRERRDTLKEYIGANNLCRRTRSGNSVSIQDTLIAKINKKVYIKHTLYDFFGF